MLSPASPCLVRNPALPLSLLRPSTLKGERTEERRINGEQEQGGESLGVKREAREKEREREEKEKGLKRRTSLYFVYRERIGRRERKSVGWLWLLVLLALALGSFRVFILFFLFFLSEAEQREREGRKFCRNDFGVPFPVSGYLWETEGLHGSEGEPTTGFLLL